MILKDVTSACLAPASRSEGWVDQFGAGISFVHRLGQCPGKGFLEEGLLEFGEGIEFLARDIG